ncbi:hypothetical protein J3R83DRAFT_13201 [Lanmaoa asiatica]|nr:hypothetical protein J3R83DRAFT_13201 [Lanmaoa asiatica]
MDAQSQNHAYTILRIKRKRTEEPLDALVVESRLRRKKTRGGVDVFQFAQTVEPDAWEDSELRQNLQSQISRLTQDSNENTKAQAPPGREARLPPVPPRTDNGAPRYAVRVTGEGGVARPKRRPTSPPKVISSKDISRNDFKMYDAVLENQGPVLPSMDPEMEKFLPMLQDYLTLQETASPSVVSNTNPYASTSDDYVWDVFYRRPYSLSEWNSFAAKFGTLYVDFADISTIQLIFKRTGLPPSMDDGDLSDNSESEEEDEADEDSNAEEYYKNDYPDEEDSDSDDGHLFHDAEDEDLISDPTDSDHDWR